jgi:hypothetical protein
VLNCVAGVPLRLDAFLPPPEQDDRERQGRITLATCEFQIADEKQAIQNEKGENSHERYKQRQRDVVLKRLSSGLVVRAGALKRRLTRGAAATRAARGRLRGQHVQRSNFEDASGLAASFNSSRPAAEKRKIFAPVPPSRRTHPGRPRPSNSGMRNRGSRSRARSDR